MNFKKKAAILSGVVAALALANLLTFIFEPGKPKTSSFAWLDPSLLVAADYIEIHRSPGANTNGTPGTPVVLVRRNNRWLLRGSEPQGSELPVKQARVEDLLSALSRKAAYPKRAFSSEARAALTLEEGRSSRILVRGGAGLPLLDLLIGTADALGREVYLRKADQNDIYSGEDLFTVYTESKRESWYDLKFFQTDKAAITADAVQQAEIRFFETSSPEDKAVNELLILRRQRSGWIIPGEEGAEIDSIRAESWLRTVLEAEGEDFGFQTPAVYTKSITLRLGDGSSRTIQAGPEGGDNRGSVVLSGSDLVYIIPEWTVNRLFRERSYFIQ